MNFYHGPFEATFNIDTGQINYNLFQRIFGGTNAGPFYDAYEDDPNIIDSTATEIIEEEEIKEQHDRDITYLPDHRRTI